MAGDLHSPWPEVFARFGVLALVVMCASACRRSSEPEAAPREPVGLRLHGARMILERDGGLEYVFDDASLPYLSMEGAYVPVEAKVGDRVLAVTSTAATPGHVLVRLGAVPADGILAAGGRTWRVLRRPAPKAWPELAAEYALAAKDPAAALARLEERMPNLDGLLLLEAHRMRVALMTELGRPNGPEAHAAREAWGASAERLGAITEQARVLRMLSHDALRDRQFAAAVERAERARDRSTSVNDVQGEVLNAYYVGLIEAELGHFRRALEATEHALDLAERHDLQSEWRYVASSRAANLLEVGRFEEAWALHQRIAEVPLPTTNIEGGAWASDRAWVLTRGMQAGAFPTDWLGVAREFEKARQQLSGEGRLDLAEIPAANLLYVRIQAGDLPGAAALIEEYANREELPPDVAVFVELMRGEFALAEVLPHKAARHFETALERALSESGQRPSDLTWRALYGRARAASGDRAAHFYEAAMDHVEAVTRHTLMAKDRASFIGDRNRLFVDAVETFAAIGRNDLALIAADRSRSQPYRVLYGRAMIEGLDEASRFKWRASLDRYDAARAEFEKMQRQAELVADADLPAYRSRIDLRRRDLERTFDEAFAFVEGAQSSLVLENLGSLQAALGPHDALLVPYRGGTRPIWFGVQIDRVRRFDELPSSPWWSTDDGVLLVATMGAENPWSVLGASASARAWLEAVPVSFVPFPSLLVVDGEDGTGRPVVVGDTASNLPIARHEAEQIARRMDATVLLGEDATRSRVLAALENTTHFHFAGHGVLDAIDPWDAHFLLARQERLTVEDIFARRPNAKHVVLNGCDTGRAIELGRNVRIGLPDAFLATGSRTVLATTRPVSDRDAAAFVERFYAEGGATDPVRAYRRAALATEDDAWSAFYVLGGRR